MMEGSRLEADKDAGESGRKRRTVGLKQKMGGQQRGQIDKNDNEVERLDSGGSKVKKERELKEAGTEAGTRAVQRGTGSVQQAMQGSARRAACTERIRR